MPTLTLHIITASRKLLLGKPCIVLSYLADGDHGGSLYRMLNHRGVQHQGLASRMATHEEAEAESHPHRYQLIPYLSWEKLFADERKWTDDAAWFAELSAIRARFPQFDTEQEKHHDPTPPNAQPTLF